MKKIFNRPNIYIFIGGALLFFIAIMFHFASTTYFHEQETIIYNNDESIILGATLTSPDMPKAGIVLATGSGPQNRDEEMGGHKPFKIIAEYLADCGYAVLRMDDRGFGESSGDFSSAINDNFVSDITAGISYLDSCYSDIPIGIIGHSEGGITAIKSAVRNDNCDFIITLAAPAWQGDSIIMSQAKAIAPSTTVWWNEEKLLRKCLDIASSDISDDAAEKILVSILTRETKYRNKSPQMEQQINTRIKELLSPWYRDFLNYNPEKDIKAVQKPWLAINGNLDCQVLPENLRSISKINSQVETVMLPYHNHLFQECTTGLPDEYKVIPTSISRKTLETISAWLEKIIQNKKI